MIKNLFLSLTLLASAVHAACPDLYPNKKTVYVKDTVELCNSFYVSVYSQKNRAVFLTSEYLEPGYRNVQRDNAFHADTRALNAVSPQEYLKTGYDKGHMAPADDALTYDQMRESFLMTNMTPQEPTLNRAAWKALEGKVREGIRRPIWVVTIAEYKDKAKLPSGVPIPTGYWKLVFDGENSQAYFAENKPHAQVSTVHTVTAQAVLNSFTE